VDGFEKGKVPITLKLEYWCFVWLIVLKMCGSCFNIFYENKKLISFLLDMLLGDETL
jgi:hypothetical protein